MAEEPKKSSLELAIDLVKAIAWPLFAFIVLISFWTPLQSAAQLLPDLVYRSDTITISNLTLKIDRNLQVQGTVPPVRVRNVLSELSPEGIATTLRTPDAVHYWSDGEDLGRREYAELLQLGVVRELGDEELDENSVFGVELSPLGQETRAFLHNLIHEFTKQLNPTRPQPTVVSQEQ